MKIYNSLTKIKEEFIPLQKGKVGMYVCGPTVYDTPHLGNALSVVTYDLLYRLLRHKFGQDNVLYVRNITDVDDKIIVRAKELNIPISELTENVTKIFHHDMDSLFCLRPNIEPKATEHIEDMIDIILKLIENSHAYLSDNHVYFSVESDVNYGALSGRVVSEMVAGSRVKVAESKHNPEDFVLWKPANEGDDASSVFDSPWGKGRPGWHIECSAMSSKYLGNDFDIHGGGADLIFPHHTNEIAQSCCANKNSKFAHYWMHNGYLTVNGEKMSKSLGNFTVLNDVLEKNIDPEVIRYVLLSTHYRKPIDWNDKVVSDAKKTLDFFYRSVENINIIDHQISSAVIQYLEDDLNTPQVFSYLHKIASMLNKTSNIELASELVADLKFLGFMNYSSDQWFKKNISDYSINVKIEERLAAKKRRDFQLADLIRDELLSQGIILEDKPNGTTKWRLV